MGKIQRTAGNIDKKKETKNSNHIIFVVYIFVFLFMGLIGYLIYFQFTDALMIKNDYRNPKLIAKSSQIKLGNIYASDGKTILAQTINKNGIDIRYYPQSDITAQLVGYTTKGRTGLESSCYNDLLMTPDEQGNFLDKIKNMGSHKSDKVGDSVLTTIDINLQRTAYNAMGRRKGAFVAIEPKTGKILAMVSKPSYDPNNLTANWNNLISDSTATPLLNRATQGLYPPGSTFKVLTALEYMREHKDYEDYRYDCNGRIKKYGLEVSCALGRAHGEENIAKALAESCNCAFIDMGLTLDISKYRKFVESFGFNNELPLKKLQYSKSKFTLTKESSYGEIMQTVFGQGNTLTTPYQNCLIAATIANNGIMMESNIIKRVIDHNGNVVSDFQPKEYKKVLNLNENEVIKNMMQGVVTNGIASALMNRNYTVACKTGTAQYNNNKNAHNLILGFAPVENPQIAFSIILEGYDGQPIIDYDAINITKTILNEYLGG